MAVRGHKGGSRRERPTSVGWSPDPPLLVRSLLLAPLLIFLVLVFIIPLAHVVWVALSQPAFGASHFLDFVHSPTARHVLFTTTRLSVTVTLLTLALGTLLAWDLRFTRSGTRRLLLWGAITFPLWTSIVVRIYALTILLEREGIVNHVLEALHLIRHPLGLLYSNLAVVVGMLYSLLPYAVLPIYATFVNIDERLVQAAESLGASRRYAFGSTVLPLALPGILASGAMVFVIAMGYYITPILLGGPSSAFLAQRIDQQFFMLYDIPGAAATGTILLFVALVIVSIVWRTVGFERVRRSVA